MRRVPTPSTHSPSVSTSVPPPRSPTRAHAPPVTLSSTSRFRPADAPTATPRSAARLSVSARSASPSPPSRRPPVRFPPRRRRRPDASERARASPTHPPVLSRRVRDEDDDELASTKSPFTRRARRRRLGVVSPPRASLPRLSRFQVVPLGNTSHVKHVSALRQRLRDADARVVVSHHSPSIVPSLLPRTPTHQTLASTRFETHRASRHLASLSRAIVPTRRRRGGDRLKSQQMTIDSSPVRGDARTTTTTTRWTRRAFSVGATPSAARPRVTTRSSTVTRQSVTDDDDDDDDDDEDDDDDDDDDARANDDARERVPSSARRLGVHRRRDATTRARDDDDVFARRGDVGARARAYGTGGGEIVNRCVIHSRMDGRTS